MEIIGYSRKEIACRSGLTPRQIQFYTEQGVVIPSINASNGRGRTRLYSYDNLFEFGLIKVLFTFGLTVSIIKKILHRLNKNNSFWSEVSFVTRTYKGPLYLIIYPDYCYKVFYTNNCSVENLFRQIDPFKDYATFITIDLKLIHKTINS